MCRQADNFGWHLSDKQLIKFLNHNFFFAIHIGVHGNRQSKRLHSTAIRVAATTLRQQFIFDLLFHTSMATSLILFIKIVKNNFEHSFQHYFLLWNIFYLLYYYLYTNTFTMRFHLSAIPNLIYFFRFEYENNFRNFH